MIQKASEMLKIVHGVVQQVLGKNWKNISNITGVAK